jgi:hypothetical protein
MSVSRVVEQQWLGFFWQGHDYLISVSHPVIWGQPSVLLNAASFYRKVKLTNQFLLMLRLMISRPVFPFYM